MRKKIVTPTSSRAANGPNHVPSFEPLRNDVWVSRTHSTAIARSESSRGKRGCPGGGATTAGVDGSPPSRAGAAAASSDEVAGSVSIDADGGTRTPKGIAHRVLSAARLPVPPHPRGTGDSRGRVGYPTASRTAGATSVAKRSICSGEPPAGERTKPSKPIS